jgi:hypothetical protein
LGGGHKKKSVEWQEEKDGMTEEKSDTAKEVLKGKVE